MESKKIYSDIAAIMQECGAIGKESVNKQQGFKYRGIDAVMNVLQPLFCKHGVFIIPEVLEHTREERKTNSGGNLIYSIIKVKYTFAASDGSSIEAVVIGEGMDSGDKATNKALAIAMKYACFQVFCIPTEEMKDPDGETPPPSTPQAHLCSDCGKEITPSKTKSGEVWSADNIVQYSKHKFERILCPACQKAVDRAAKDAFEAKVKAEAEARKNAGETT